ncbi:MAG TPA: hypothetical protein VEY89_00515 [Candidatus Dormibacteraeota bacterium]|nr:hypothetical protein [Candidatus Dormibacteraeota bacterium]
MLSTRGRILAAATVIGAALCTACGSTSGEQRYQPPPAGTSGAEVIGFGSIGGTTTTCQFSGKPCRAWVVAVDDKFTSGFATTTAVSEGTHKVLLACYSWSAPPTVAAVIPKSGVIMANGNVVPEYTALTGPFAAAHKYYLHCDTAAGAPRVFLADSPDGPALPGFE